MVSDKVIEKEYVHSHGSNVCTDIPCRKDKPIGQFLNQPFTWSDAIDAAADVYNGVSLTMFCM